MSVIQYMIHRNLSHIDITISGIKEIKKDTIMRVSESTVILRSLFLNYPVFFCDYVDSTNSYSSEKFQT